MLVNVQQVRLSNFDRNGTNRSLGCQNLNPIGPGKTGDRKLTPGSM